MIQTESIVALEERVFNLGFQRIAAKKRPLTLKPTLDKGKMRKKKYPIIDGQRIFKATNVRGIHPIYLEISKNLSKLETLKFIKILNGRIIASNFLSDNKKKEPIVEIGKENIVGVELLIDIDAKTIQFFALTSSIKGFGEKIVASIVKATPKNWYLCVVMDWSGGFWQKMQENYPQIIII